MEIVFHAFVTYVSGKKFEFGGWPAKRRDRSSRAKKLAKGGGILARGDHIKVRRFGLLYAHHGIDLGDGRVVHFGEPGKDMPQAVVRVTSLEAFLKGGQAVVVAYPPGQALPPEESVRLALAEVGRRGYNLAFNNCEHFATYCKTGRKDSRQVWRAALGLAAAAAVVVASVGLKLIRRR